MKAFLALLFSVLSLVSFAQKTADDSTTVVALNQQIDDYVVAKNVMALEKLYADDFVFSHGSGKVEGKAGWLTTVARAEYTLRQHDSVKAELHPGLVIIKGKMNIIKVNKEKTDKYWLKYIRVYALQNKSWQLISHTSMQEQHEK